MNNDHLNKHFYNKHFNDHADIHRISRRDTKYIYGYEINLRRLQYLAHVSAKNGQKSHVFSSLEESIQMLIDSKISEQENETNG